jgi:hypothetical protein
MRRTRDTRNEPQQSTQTDAFLTPDQNETETFEDDAPMPTLSKRGRPPKPEEEKASDLVCPFSDPSRENPCTYYQEPVPRYKVQITQLNKTNKRYDDIFGMFAAVLNLVRYAAILHTQKKIHCGAQIW